jgi:hypothetical protein
MGKRMVEYLATNSRLSLEEFCERLRANLDLPPFHYDSEDGDPYAWVDVAHVRINVSRPNKPDRLQEWMPNTPSGSTFQIILIVAEDAPCEWTADWSRTVLLPKYIGTIEEVTGCSATHYHTLT